MPLKIRSFHTSILGFFSLCLLNSTVNPAFAQSGKLETARDLQVESRLAKQRHGPLIILFSRKDCKFCEEVRRDYLIPLIQHSRYKDKVLVRQIDQDSNSELTDFNGQASKHSEFARKEKVGFVPVVAFYGDNGKQLTAPIIGLRLPDFYQSYLEDAIDKSISRQQ